MFNDRFLGNMGAPLRSLSDGDEFEYAEEEVHDEVENVDGAMYEGGSGGLEAGNIAGASEKASSVKLSPDKQVKSKLT